MPEGLMELERRSNGSSEVYKPTTQECAYHVARRLHAVVLDMERRTPCETPSLLSIAIKNL